MSETCPWCSAPRGPGATCPKCGANYAKAAAIKAHGRAPAEPAAAAQPRARGAADATSAMLAAGDGDETWKHIEDPDLELRFRIGAIPVMLLIALAFQVSNLGGALQRIFLTMPVHELGHAVTAWFCGYTAIPTLWKTLVPETRGFVAPLALLGALAWTMYRAHLAGNRVLLGLGGVLIGVQAIGTFGLDPFTARMLVTFGGDGMGMVLATALMATFFFGRNTQLYRGWLRWGFVAIGAAAFVDMYATWWRARGDVFAVPYGTTGGQASDSMTLVDVHGWPMQVLIDRYFALGLVCLLALAAVYAWGVRQAMQRVRAREREERLASLKRSVR